MTLVSDHAVVGHVISAFDVDNAIECGWECLTDKRCVSYNYQVKTNQKDICEINDQTKSTKPTDYQPKPGVTYYELMSDIGTVSQAVLFCISCPFVDCNRFALIFILHFIKKFNFLFEFFFFFSSYFFCLNFVVVVEFHVNI